MYKTSMGCVRVCLVTAIVALAACSGDSAGPDAKTFMDAPPNYDWSCMGNTAPTTATDAVTVSGIVQEIYSKDGTPSVRPIPDALLLACSVSATCDGTTNDGITTSAADGTFSVGPHPIGGVPYDSYMLVSREGFDRTTYLYPASPLIADNTGVKIPIMQNAFIAQLNALGISQAANKSIVGLQLVDCMEEPITDSANVQLSIKVDGVDVTGFGTSIINAGQFSADFAGDWFIINVPEGTTEVGATWNGKPLRPRTITTIHGTTSETKLRPGF